MQHLRTDRKTEAAVNQGLAAVLLADTATGVRIMSEQGVPAAVMTRILLAPQERRASDWKQP